MYEIKKTVEFDIWFLGIRDVYVRNRLLARLRKVSLGNFGDISAVGDGIWEMREHFGSGWRMYFVRHGKLVVLMLGGGSKSSQSMDIKQAKKLLHRLED